MEYQKLITAFTSLLILNCTASSEENGRSVELLSDSQLKTFSSVAQSPLNRMPKRKAWKEAVPEAQWITIPSTADGTTQSAIFYDSENSRKRPLLVALHSWSSDYEKQFSIPFGVWAVKNDWVFIHPDYRGAYIDSESTASEYAIQDILDALEYAKNNANVDESRIYLTGFSGGGMTTLIMAGRFPQLWTAAAAWVPVYDLPQWYETTKRSRQTYAAHIENSCGGPPEPGTKAYRECKKRSVSTYLKNARNKEIQIFIATGIKDVFVPPGHSFQAFNDLAKKKDRFTREEITFINKHLKLPDRLEGNYPDSLFEDAGYNLIFQRSSSNAVLKIYDGNHDIVFNAGLVWLSKQR